MPSTVFERLPQLKKDVIVNAAIKEFSTSTYEKAKVVNICEHANIPRVTFYSYFDSLDDIYMYLIQEFKSKCLNDDFYSQDNVIDYFLSLIQSSKGLKEVYSSINELGMNEKRISHLCVSICLQYTHGVITYTELLKEVEELTKEYYE